MMEMDDAVRSSAPNPGSRLVLFEALTLQRSRNVDIDYGSFSSSVR